MKLKRRRKPAESDPATECFRKVRGPHKGHASHDYEAAPKPSKAQRARRRGQLRERYGPLPQVAGPTEYMSTEERRAMRKAVFAAAGYRCQACGSARRLTLDHIVPRHCGGGNHLANLQCLCDPCNKAKGLGIWRAGDGTAQAVFL